MKLFLKECVYYRVKRGQTLSLIARAYSCPVHLIARVNGLKEEVRAGQVIKIPERKGNLYCVQGGESKSLLCGGKEAFVRKNGTDCFYPTQKIFL